MRIAYGGLLAAALMLASATAGAQVDEQRAREAFEQAEVEFNRGNYALALQGFQRSYELMEGHPRRPLILFNIGRSYEELGRFREARDAYRQYLRDSGSEAIEREETEARLRELETRLSMAADDAGDRSTEQASTESRARPPDGAAEPPGGGGISPVGPIVMGVGGAMLIAGAITGAVTLSTRSDVTAMCTGTSCPESARGLASDVDTLAITTDVLLFGGAAVAAAGLILTLVLTEDGGGDTAAAFTCGGDGCMAVLAGGFE